MNNRKETIHRIVNESLLLEKKKKTIRQRLARGALGFAVNRIALPVIYAGIDRETVYGMGGNAPVVGEYSGPQSQIK